MSKVYVLVDERLMAAKNPKRSRHPRHFVVAAYSSMKKAQEAADGYLEALSFAPQGQGWKQGKLKGEITKTESSGKKSDKYGSLHATYRDDEAVLGHLRILTLTVNQPPEDEIDYMTAETFGAEGGRETATKEVMARYGDEDWEDDEYEEVIERRLDGYCIECSDPFHDSCGMVSEDEGCSCCDDTRDSMDDEEFGAERQVYVLRFGDPMRYGKAVEIPFLTKNEAERYVDMHIRPWNKNHPWDEINYSITQETQFNAESFGAESKFDKLAKEIASDYRKKGKSPEEALEIGEATAAKIGRAKYGKKKFARMGKKAETPPNNILPAFGLAIIGGILYGIFLNGKKE